MPRFAELPVELYDAILSHVPSSSLQQTVLSLMLALPFSPVPKQALFRSIRFINPEKIIHLYHILRAGHSADKTEILVGSAVTWIREISIETWTADANIIINLIKLIPKFESLSLWIGPNNFAPEELEEIFQSPIVGLKYLALRFRPYLQRANYYQFLKGAYFDSTLLALSRWPSSQLVQLSIVQDPVDPAVAEKQTFAQPIVFFRLDPYLSLLLRSPSFLHSLSSLRLRIPSRSVVRSICTAQTHQNYIVAPALEYLDLSTCNVLSGEIETILVHFQELKHLVLDECTVLRGELREGEWAAMGKSCALAGVKRAKEREKRRKSWLETHGSSLLGSAISAPIQTMAPRPTRRGRRGLATSTISLRDRPENLNVPTAIQQPGSSTTSHISTQKIRILPPIPTLLSLSIMSPFVKPDKYDIVRAEFEAGWAEGIAQLEVTRARIKASARNGVRVVQFATGLPREEESYGSEQGIDGLEDFEWSDNAFSIQLDDVNVPVLCLLGSGGDQEHDKRCGHSVGKMIWKDDI